MHGSNSNFATVITCPGIFRGAANVPKQIFPLAQLCNSDPKARIRFIYRNLTTQQEFNAFNTTLEDLQAGRTTLNGVVNTNLIIEGFQVRIRPGFLDYLRSGWQISLVAAIDYTGSNGVPTMPNSLHYMGAGAN